MRSTAWIATVAGAFAVALWASAFAEDAVPPGGQRGPGGGGGRGALREKLLEKFDKDGDGKLSEEERAAARDAIIDRIFQKFDADGNGQLSKDELRAALKELRGRLDGLRDRIRERVQERRGGGGPRG
jgi:hypothetical protein